MIMFDFYIDDTRINFNIEKFELAYEGKVKKLNYNRFIDNKRTAYLKLNDACNLNCIYCFQRYEQRNMKYFEIEDYKDILNYIFDEFNNIVLFGGEPLLDINTKAWNYILSMCKKYEVNIYTNGCFNEKQLELLDLNKDKINRLIITLDGPKNIHDNRRILLNASSYDKIFENTNKLLKRGITFQIQINVDSLNIDYIEKLLESLLSEFGENNLVISLNKVLHSEYTISDIVFLKRYVELRKKFSKMNIIVNSNIYKSLDCILTDKGYISKRCSIGDVYVFDFTNDVIYSCPECNTSYIGFFDFGKINTDNIARNKMINYSNKNTDVCNECIYKSLCGYGCYVDRDITGNSCKVETKECIQYILNNYKYFWKNNLIKI